MGGKGRGRESARAAAVGAMRRTKHIIPGVFLSLGFAGMDSIGTNKRASMHGSGKRSKANIEGHEYTSTAAFLSKSSFFFYECRAFS